MSSGQIRASKGSRRGILRAEPHATPNVPRRCLSKSLPDFQMMHVNGFFSELRRRTLVYILVGESGAPLVCLMDCSDDRAPSGRRSSDRTGLGQTPR